MSEKTKVFNEFQKQITQYNNQFETKTLIFNQFKSEL